jgi:hypothetical protein
MAVALDAVAVQLALGGHYYDKVTAHASLQGCWLLNEFLSATGARDSSTHNRNGTCSGFAIDDFGKRGALPHGGTALHFDGVDAHVTMGDVAAFEFTGAFSVECLFRSAANGCLVSKVFINTPAGWAVNLAAGAIQFGAWSAAGVNIFGVLTPSTYTDGLDHHVICTWDGTTNANGVKIYVDGALANQGTAAAGTIAQNGARMLIGAQDQSTGTITGFIDAVIQGVAVYNAALSSADVTAHYDATQWTAVTDDVLGPELTIDVGINGVGPLDRVASAGTLRFALDNTELNSAGLRGYYSPHHANVRSGFAFDIPVRVQFVVGGTTYTRFWGRLEVIDVEAGTVRGSRTYVTAHDYMFILEDRDVREIAAQENKSEVELMKAVFESLPHDAQPMEAIFQAAVDTYAYAFYDLAGGVKAATAVSRATLSAWGRTFARADGTFAYVNRQSVAEQAVNFSFTDPDVLDLISPSDRSNIYDHIRVVVHPKDVDAAATTVLYSHPNGADVFLEANGGSRELWCEYRNPTDDYRTTIGGTAMVTPVENTDYDANSVATGGGTDLSASLTVVATFFASVAKLVLTNNHATLGAYMVDSAGASELQIRGKGIYDLRPITLEARGTNPTRPITIDLPYQTSAAIGQDIADIVLNERQDLSRQVDAIQLSAHTNATTMACALQSEPMSVVAITEGQTGVTELQAQVQSVHLALMPGLILDAEIGVVPITVGEGWLLGTVGRSELEETTVLGAG